MTCIVTALLCLEMQYFVSNANFVFTASFLAPYTRQTTENRVGANSSGGRFRRLTIAAL